MPTNDIDTVTTGKNDVFYVRDKINIKDIFQESKRKRDVNRMMKRLRKSEMSMSERNRRKENIEDAIGVSILIVIAVLGLYFCSMPCHGREEKNNYKTKRTDVYSGKNFQEERKVFKEYYMLFKNTLQGNIAGNVRQ